MSVKDKCNENTLKALRKKLRINQTQFAKALGVRQQTVSEWERGIYRPALSIEQIKTLEDMLSRVGLKFRDLPDDLSQ
ncbi:helix-turn-helix transcriptional regulator [Picosynechococcus sp. NKBG042902]|uniref:helix-turn-helix transcriptional regulator n=1 Tax=Picosynechococcus sp. NKBG042902 TaxID=490193 RepID=UPI0004A9F0F9|nr:helix-turn-helix transcriptional regulator [Picosynechococcus sp. NKBG042902]